MHFYYLLPIIISSNITNACYRFVSAAYINLYYFDVCMSRIDLPIGLMPDLDVCLQFQSL